MLIVQNKCTQIPTSSFADILENIESVTNIIIAIVGVFIAVEGIKYLNTLKERRAATTFTFWIQLEIRIREILIALKDNHSIINGLYSDDARTTWSNQGTSGSDDMVNRFYTNIQETLEFLKGAEDQIPVNTKWLKDYRFFIKFLIDVSQYDIRCTDALFKFSDAETEIDRDKYCSTICKVMDNLLTDIETEQTTASEELDKFRKKQRKKSLTGRST